MGKNIKTKLIIETASEWIQIIWTLWQYLGRIVLMNVISTHLYFHIVILGHSNTSFSWRFQTLSAPLNTCRAHRLTASASTRVITLPCLRSTTRSQMITLAESCDTPRGDWVYRCTPLPRRELAIFTQVESGWNNNNNFPVMWGNHPCGGTRQT